MRHEERIRREKLVVTGIVVFCTIEALFLGVFVGSWAGSGIVMISDFCRNWQI